LCASSLSSRDFTLEAGWIHQEEKESERGRRSTIELHLAITVIRQAKEEEEEH
jgi:hypothetical protein